MSFYTDGKAEPLMTWDHVKKYFPWDVILLLGGGFAMAQGTVVSFSTKLTMSLLINVLWNM